MHFLFRSVLERTIQGHLIFVNLWLPRPDDVYGRAKLASSATPPEASCDITIENQPIKNTAKQ